MASKVVKKDNISSSGNQQKKLVIVIEGVDKVVDSKGIAVTPAFWLPETLPQNVKLIVSANKKSAAYKYYVGIGCNILEYSLSEAKKHKIISELHPKIKGIECNL